MVGWLVVSHIFFFEFSTIFFFSGGVDGEGRFQRSSFFGGDIFCTIIFLGGGGRG